MAEISRSEERYEFPFAINPYFNIHTEIINVSACTSVRDFLSSARVRYILWITKATAYNVDSRSISRSGNRVGATSRAKLELICRRFIIQSQRGLLNDDL